MKSIPIEQTSLDSCVAEAQRERVVLTRNGHPVALVVGVEGMDEEQLELGANEEFWKLIAERRKQKTISRAELEQQLNNR